MDHNDDDDKNQSLHQLGLNRGASIISQLVDIGSERNQQDHDKLRRFMSQFQCLTPKGTQLHRKSIDAVEDRQYVALSYTWQPSENEDAESGHYWVKGWGGDGFAPSKVRNCVFDRVLGYMRHNKVRFLWIDAHCIPQDTCDAACTRHARCAQKRDALQAMDLVYSWSEHPVAILGRPMRTVSELRLLDSILSGKLVRNNRLQVPSHRTSKALRLLHEMTQDDWWGRAWTFQENYRAMERMTLLIRHGPQLEKLKRRCGGFGTIPGELCVSSVDFSMQATILCRAARSSGVLLPGDGGRIDEVLRAAGRYTVLLSKSSVMTPRVIADIEARGLSKPWDRLGIVANCCQYSLRLDGDVLRGQRRSLSLSVLAMCLLNGEILDNNSDTLRPVAGLTASSFLQKYLFDGFSAPEDEPRYLTFNKGCRLSSVELTADGISAKGHLWKLGRVIDTADDFSVDRSRRYRSNKKERRDLLLPLIDYLREKGHITLADHLTRHLGVDADAGEGYGSFADIHLHDMASHVVAAIKAGRKLILGCIRDPNNKYQPHRAVFVLPREDDRCRRPKFVFTSAWPRHPGSETHDANDLDRHVSLGVDLDASLIDGTPRLRVRSWLLGMCFFRKCECIDVVFPWPRALQASG
ncbi:hypothetical protein MHUMG1_03573 [Metarhizium humberi]|uniref:Heterokaryon incompatibility domain-containing protein n=1 Tax=Metarhizium humberi TaxID=2596975 RepID=A0A9P8S829_9HYPO|nr:hypothetical protein MHUMG1_03573 [Metarhizium humberi]